MCVCQSAGEEEGVGHPGMRAPCSSELSDVGAELLGHVSRPVICFSDIFELLILYSDKWDSSNSLLLS